MEREVKQLLEFIKSSPSCFHVIENVKNQLLKAGFLELMEKEAWNLEHGKSYFVIRNGSSIAAFHIPEQDFCGFHIVASHSDSPTFRIKDQPEMEVEKHYTKLNVEKYGGMILDTWFDRPLSMAGRIIIEENGKLTSRLVNIDRDLLIIPNLAIHMSGRDRKEWNPQKDLLPLLCASEKEGGILTLLAEEGRVDKDQILSYDVFLYNRMPGTVLGTKEELIASPKLDDLECAYASVQAIFQAKSEDYVDMCCIFDNEEVGSATKQGAGSTFLPEVLRRICSLLGKTEEGYQRAIADSFLISADNAHGVHPNYTEKTDPTNRPYLNHGIVLKYNAAQKYTTDAWSGAVIKYLCKKEKIPCQVYYNRSDMAGGSTLGNILTGQVSMRSADIGLAQLAMHSSYETAGAKDLESMIRLMTAFYGIGREVEL